MTAYDDETLMRRIDGELTPDQGVAIDAAAATDPVLAARLAAMKGLRRAARDAFPIAPDPRDRDLSQLIMAGPARRPGVAERLWAFLAESFAPRRAVVWGGLATAAFVGGVIVAPMLNDAGPEFSVGRDGAIADAGLIRVLDDRLAADGADGEGRAVGLTYRAADGRWCRTFRAGEAGVAGLACRQGEGWSLNVLAPLDTSGGEIRTASVDTPEVVLSAVDGSIRGETLDAAAEASARDSGWR
jgi:hypothetical protein